MSMSICILSFNVVFISQSFCLFIHLTIYPPQIPPFFYFPSLICFQQEILQYSDQLGVSVLLSMSLLLRKFPFGKKRSHGLILIQVRFNCNLHVYLIVGSRRACLCTLMHVWKKRSTHPKYELLILY